MQLQFDEWLPRKIYNCYSRIFLCLSYAFAVNDKKVDMNKRNNTIIEMTYQIILNFKSQLIDISLEEMKYNSCSMLHVEIRCFNMLSKNGINAENKMNLSIINLQLTYKQVLLLPT